MSGFSQSKGPETSHYYERLLLISEDGVEKGGVEIPEIRDKDYSVTIILRPGTVHTTGLHWHEEKTEYLQVLQGHARITVGEATSVFGPNDGVITVPRFTLHEFGRADHEEQGAVSKDVELRIKEWTGPPDVRKEIFFRNIFGAINNRGPGFVGAIKVGLSLVAVMRAHDSYPVIILGPKFLGKRGRIMFHRAITHAVLGCVGLVSSLLGYRGTQEQFTPPELLEAL